MDYIRIKTTSRDSETQSLRDAKSSSVSMSSSSSASESTANDIKELLKDWIKLYPNSFASDVDFKIYQLADGDIIIQLHEDLSSMAVALLVLYLKPIANSQQPIAYISIDDTEVVLKQNIGKRAMLTTHGSQSTTIRILLDDNYVLDYDFERKPQPVKDSELQFEETEFTLPEEYESVVVGDVVKKEIDKVLEDEGLTPKKLMWYLICGAVGLAIGFLIVYLTGK